MEDNRSFMLTHLYMFGIGFDIYLFFFFWLVECMDCPVGYFCGAHALVQPSGPCAPGFLCFLRATVPNPTDNNTGALCPPGAYCQLGVRTGTAQSFHNILRSNDNTETKNNSLERLCNGRMTRKRAYFLSLRSR